MQPAEDNPITEKELVAHIKARLTAHEEAYVEGAWEKFNTEEKTRKKPVFWTAVLRGAAAILVIGFIAFLFSQHDQTKHGKVEQQVVRKALKQEDPLAGVPLRPKTAVPQRPLGRPKLAKSATFTTAVKKNLMSEIPVANAPKQEVHSLALVKKATPVQAKESIPVVEKELSGAAAQARPAIIDFLNKETEKNEIAQTGGGESKLTLGLVIAPSFGNTKKLNMGYGISMDYNLSEKISVNSGLAYNQMTAVKSIPAPQSAALVSGDTKSLESIEEQVVGVDIPLEVRYHFNKNIYANVGVSAFAVFDQNRDNTYVSEKVVQSAPPVNGAQGSQQIGATLVSERTVERTAASSVGRSSFLGFYNFSVGYKKKIAKDHAIAIEPFMKLPMKTVDKESLNLIGTGIKLRFEF